MTLEKLTDKEAAEIKYLNETISRIVRPWYKQVWAWVTGRL